MRFPTCFLAIALSLLTLAAQAQTAAPETPWARLQWSSSAAASRYSEPSINMKIAGPELGLHLRMSELRGLPWLQVEADGLLGAQRYSSADGKLDDRRSFDLRGRVLYPLVPTEAGRGLYTGLGLEHSYTDLRGRLSSGARGYERVNQTAWLALQWRQGLKWDAVSPLQSYQVDLGYLLGGRQHSYLSQVGGNWRDTTNKQSSGWYLQVQSSWAAERGLTIEPFLRYSQIGKSDTVDGGVRPVYEPANNRWQLGLKATWPPN